MEIGRSTLASGGYPAATARSSGAGRTAAIDQAAPAPRARAAEAGARVLQGELLERERSRYQSTRAYLDERAFDQSRYDAAPRVRAAIALYHGTAPREPVEVAAATAPSINFFV